MSPRAASRLADLGFEQVYDYVPGKMDWRARGLPTEGDQAAVARAHHHARVDVVTVAGSESARETAALIEASPYPFGLVIDAGRIVLGRVPLSEAQKAASAAPVGEIMSPGPTTVRADVRADELVARLTRQQLHYAIVTTPEGRLCGIVRRSDLETADLP